MSARLAAGITLLILTAAIEAQQQPTFRSRVDLAVLNVSVVDGAGRSVPNLTRDAFAVKENGRPQTIVQFAAGAVPVRILVALDASGSMQGQRFDFAHRAILRFLDQLGPDDQLSVIGFNSRVFPVVGWTRDRDRVADALDKIRPAGATALYDAVTDGVGALEEEDYRRQALVVISDGNDMIPRPRLTTENDWTSMLAERAQAARDLVRQSEILVYAIGVTGGSSRTLDASSLKELTDPTGGYTHIVSTPQAITPAAEHIAQELKQHYVIGFEPTEKRDGRFHRVTVSVSGCQCTARTRAGFIAQP